jgi:hypothetical protein
VEVSKASITQEQFDDWLATRPDSVQKLAKEFPLGTTFQFAGEEGPTLHLIGYTENDWLIVSRVDPFQDCEAARLVSEYLYVPAVREAMVDRRH